MNHMKLLLEIAGRVAAVVLLPLVLLCYLCGIGAGKEPE